MPLRIGELGHDPREHDERASDGCRRILFAPGEVACHALAAGLADDVDRARGELDVDVRGREGELHVGGPQPADGLCRTPLRRSSLTPREQHLDPVRVVHDHRHDRAAVRRIARKVPDRRSPGCGEDRGEGDRACELPGERAEGVVIDRQCRVHGPHVDLRERGGVVHGHVGGRAAVSRDGRSRGAHRRGRHGGCLDIFKRVAAARRREDDPDGERRRTGDGERRDDPRRTGVTDAVVHGSMVGVRRRGDKSSRRGGAVRCAGRRGGGGRVCSPDPLRDPSAGLRLRRWSSRGARPSRTTSSPFRSRRRSRRARPCGRRAPRRTTCRSTRPP